MADIPRSYSFFFFLFVRMETRTGPCMCFAPEIAAFLLQNVKNGLGWSSYIEKSSIESTTVVQFVSDDCEYHASTCAPWQHARRRPCPGARRSRVRAGWADANHQRWRKCRRPTESLGSRIYIRLPICYSHRKRQSTHTTVDLSHVRQLSEGFCVTKGNEGDAVMGKGGHGRNSGGFLPTA